MFTFAATHFYCFCYRT